MTSKLYRAVRSAVTSDQGDSCVNLSQHRFGDLQACAHKDRNDFCSMAHEQVEHMAQPLTQRIACLQALLDRIGHVQTKLTLAEDAPETAWDAVKQDIILAFTDLKTELHNAEVCSEK